MRKIITLSLFLFSCQVCLGQKNIIDKAGDFAENLAFIDMEGFLYNIEGYDFRLGLPKGREHLAPNFDFLDSLSIAQMDSLLNHENPQIRCLGVLSLYRLDDHRQLLRVSEYLDDRAICFKNNPYRRFRFLSNAPTSVPSEKKMLKRAEDLSIAEIARSILSFYYSQTLYAYRKFETHIEAFIEERKAYDYTAGFLAMLQIKATSGVLPIQETRRVHIEAFRKRIHSIPDPIDQALYKLYLGHSRGVHLFSQNERKEELLKLGKGLVKAILSGNLPTNDPDITRSSDLYSSNYIGYLRMCQWILWNAPEIFEEADIPFLLQRASYEKDSIPESRYAIAPIYWHLAIVKINPSSAPRYLHEYLDPQNPGKYHIYDQTLAARKLWRIAGKKEAKPILDWLFRYDEQEMITSNKMGHFSDSLNQKQDLPLLELIVLDERFDHKVSAKQLSSLASHINSLFPESPINQELITSVIWSAPDDPYRNKKVEALKMEMKRIKWPE